MTGQIFADFSSASLPIVLLILGGYLVKRLLLRDEVAWGAIDTLNFQILIPALILGTISQAALVEISAWGILVCIFLVLVGLSVILGVVYWLWVPKWMAKDAYSTVFQTSTRWNASIALVVITAFFDVSAVAVVAVVMVGLMPLVNVINIAVLVRLHNASGSMFWATMVNVLKNPIILACLMGIAISVLNLNLPLVVQESLNLMGHASIATVLLSLGAGLRFSQVRSSVFPIVLSIILKLLAMPMMVFAVGWALGIAHNTLIVMTIATAMPTAMNGYVVAKKMGGDAALYASCGTMQTFLSFATVPLWMLLFLLFFRPVFG